MTANFYSLPFEIRDLCIDKLYETENDEARATMRACALVSRSFCHRARKHLFKHIVFHGQPVNKVSDKLHSLLELLGPEVKFSIASYVSALEIIIDSAAENASEDYSTLLRDDNGDLCSVLKAMLGPHHTFRRFSLAMSSSPPTKAGFVDWSDLSATLQESICALISTANLAFLHIGNITGLPSNLICGTKLEHLHLSHTDFAFSNDSSIAAEKENIKNTALGCVTMNPADCLTGIAGGYLDYLTCLSTFTSTIFSHKHMDITMEVMEASASSIESLQLDFYERFPPPPKPFDFGQMTKLQNLALTHTVLMPDEDIEITTVRTLDEDVVHIHALLNTPTPALSLKRLDIMITSWQIFPDEDFFKGFHHSSEWHLIDSLLTSSKFPCLSNVDLFISLPMLVEQARSFDQKAFKTKVSGFFKQVLPGLTASKSISLGLDIQIILFGWGNEGAAIGDGEEVVITALMD